MIAQLRGKLLLKTPTQSVIDCSGVGYEVNHTPFTAEKMPQGEVSLYIYTYVKEDILQLYGFYDPAEKESFKQLIRVSSVGPKLALSILSSLAYQELWSAVQARDFSRLQGIPGIGKKTAERLSLELKDRIPNISFQPGPAGATSGSQELESILLNLGYQRNEVQRSLKKISDSDENFYQEPLETAVRRALSELTGSA